MMVLAGWALAWQIAARALAHAYAETDPGLALSLKADNPQAQLNVANRLVTSKPGSSNPGAAEKATRRLMTTAPLQSGALRDLGIVADANGQEGRAQAIMGRAGARGFRDNRVQVWLFQQALSRHDSGETFLRMDAVLRTNPDLDARMFPWLASLLNDPGNIGPLSRRLAADPSWRESALIYLSTHAQDFHPVANLFDALVKLGRGPTDHEAEALLGRMAKEGRYEEAYLLWVSYLPPRALGDLGDLYDGAFQGLPGSPPFNWGLFRAPGRTVAIAKPTPSAKYALHIEYPVETSLELAEQILVLPAGSYRLSGQFMVSRPAAGAHLQWTVICAISGATLAATRESGDSASGWRPFSVDFEVPDHCTAQCLRLEGHPGDEFGDLSAWYGDLAIQPGSPRNPASAGAPADVER